MKRTKEGDLDSSGLHKMPVVESGRQGHSAKVSQVVKVGYIDILDSALSDGDKGYIAIVFCLSGVHFVASFKIMYFSLKMSTW